MSDGRTAIGARPFGTTESNEENARSLVGIVEFGAFRYHFGGDLTGRGVSGIPDVESHLVEMAAGPFYGTRGVDVAHAHHHARRTSSNAALVEMLAPKDGRARNVIGGINATYVGSPQQETLDAWLADRRLGEGWFWVTTAAPSSGTHTRLIEANGDVTVQTIGQGRGYRVQAAGARLFSQAYESVRAQP